MVPFNLFYSLYQALEAGVNTLRDPGSGGTVSNIKQSFSILNITSTGARTLDAAANVPLGAAVLVVSSASSATVNGTSITDGGYLIFIRGVNASGVAEWEVLDHVGLAARVTALETIPVNVQVGTSYTILASDNGKLVTFDNGAAITVTVPTGLAVGFNCKVLQLGAGLVTFQGDGTMVVNTESGALTLDAAPGRGDLIVYATNLCNFARYDVSAA